VSTFARPAAPRWALPALVAAGLLGLALLVLFDLGPPLAFNDDWDFAWNVRHFGPPPREYPAGSALALVHVAFAWAFLGSRLPLMDEHGRALNISRPSPYGWNVSGYQDTVVIEYTVFGDRADGTYDGIDETHAHLNLPATLAWAHGYENRPASLKFDLPHGWKWKVATQLARRENGTWWAPNLEMLMDSPVELSAHMTREWKVEDATFRLALHHGGTEQEAAAYVEEQLPSFGDAAQTIMHDAYISLPRAASLRITRPESRDLPCITHSMGIPTGPRAVGAEVVYAGKGAPEDYAKAGAAGKIALVEGEHEGRAAARPPLVRPASAT